MIKKSLLSLTISGLMLANVHAYQDVDAKSLVGQTYGGVHAIQFNADASRLINKGSGNTNLDDGNGLGLEFGYRLSEFSELRLKYTDLTIDTDPNKYGEVEGSSVGVDFLFFPNKKSIYFVAGFNELDLVTDELSANIGLGARYYFTERLATYFEAKGHYQFEDSQKDFSSTIGLIYYFGSNNVASKPAIKPVTKPKALAAEKAAPVTQLIDTDKDGVIDSKDQCANTPVAHLVDENGCTIFATKEDVMELSINFDNNSDVVKPDYFAEIERAADFMKRYSDVNLTIEGHTSSQGKAAYNNTLSQKRADAVMAILINQYGVNANRLTAIGYGEDKLINTENTAQAHAQNRRIQARVSVSKKVAETK